MMDLWNKGDSLFSPKLFKFMLMIPTIKDQLSTTNQETVHTDYKQSNMMGADVHPADLAGSLIKDFLIKGGDSKSAHIISKSQELASALKNFVVELKPNTSNQVKFPTSRPIDKSPIA
jgi:hypothetical protein